jgi:ribosomal protein S18 acetylase RimI-like enzyme
LSAAVRRATAADARQAAQLLHDFNTEYGEATPGVDVLTKRVAALIDRDEIVVLLAGDRPDGIAQLAFRPSVWSDAPDAYLAELYVAPGRRGQGLGKALLTAAIELASERRADVIDLNTSDDDTAAIGLYESSGFTNREGGPEGPRMRYYELGL